MRPGLGQDLRVAITARVETRCSQRREEQLDEPSQWVVWQASAAETQPGAVVGLGDVEQGYGHGGSDANGDGVPLEEVVFGDALGEALDGLQYRGGHSTDWAWRCWYRTARHSS